MCCHRWLTIIRVLHSTFRSSTSIKLTSELLKQKPELMEESGLSPPPPKRRKISCSEGSYVTNLQTNLQQCNELEDVTFLIGKEKEAIKGVRCVFALQSPVFKAMLYGHMMESNASNNDEPIVIDDVSPGAFKFIKDAFYLRNPAITNDIVLNLLYASKKYLLLDTEIECYKFIESLNNLQDWWNIILNYDRTDDICMYDALIRKSKLVINNSDRIIKNETNIFKLKPQWLAKLIQSNCFVINDEIQIWDICMKYCKNYATSKITSYVDLRYNTVHFFYPCVQSVSQCKFHK